MQCEQKHKLRNQTWKKKENIIANGEKIYIYYYYIYILIDKKIYG